MQGSDRLQPEIKLIQNTIDDGKSITVTVRNYRKNGTLFWNELFLLPHALNDGAVAYYEGIIREVTIAKKTLIQTINDARTDRLTDLVNRYTLLRRN